MNDAEWLRSAAARARLSRMMKAAALIESCLYDATTGDVIETEEATRCLEDLAEISREKWATRMSRDALAYRGKWSMGVLQAWKDMREKSDEELKKRAMGDSTRP